MPDRYPHLSREAAELADAPDANRIWAIQTGAWVSYPRGKAILDKMEELLAHPPILRMPNLLVVGASNNGKTQLLRHFLEKHPQDPNPAGDAAIVPVIYVQAPTTPDIRDLCVRILNSVNAPYKESGSAADRIYTVKKLLASLNTRMLLIDDIQHMLSGGAVKQREFRNAIKDLGNELRISVVAAGIEDAYTVFVTDEQLSNRFEPATLPLWKMDKDYGRLLATLEQRLPLRKPSDLKSPELMQKIYWMSEGPFGEIHAVLKKAAIQAIRSKTEQITLELLNGLQWIQPSARKARPALT